MKKDIKVLGIDLAKNIFQLHGINSDGCCTYKKRLTKPKLINELSNFSSCLIGIEACGTAHYWARTLISMGHDVKIMAPQFVKPYLKNNKNDMNDAEAICEAVTRPTMKFVPMKTVEQQDILLVHRARELAVKHRTALSNQIRGLLAEYGLTMKQGISQVRELPAFLDEHKEQLSIKAFNFFTSQYELFDSLDAEIKKYEKEIKVSSMEDERCVELQKIPGIGPLTSTALIGAIGDANVFKNGREVAAWLGLTPKQHSSGHRIKLGGISKRGDSYLRKLLIHGARTVIKSCEKRVDRLGKWAASKKERCGYNKASVALANKNARIIWSILTTGECYNPDHCSKR